MNALVMVYSERSIVGIEKLEELQRNLDMSYVEDNQTSIGIFNVNSRIKLFYGK